MSKRKGWLHALLVGALLLTGAYAPPKAANAEEPAAAAAAPGTVYAYDQPTKYAPSANYTLKVNGVAVPVVKAYNEYDYAHFSVGEGPVTYEVTILNTDKVHEYAISPKKLGIRADSVVGRTLTFTAASPEYLIVMMNNRTTRLVLAADPAETDVPAASGTGVFNVSAVPYDVGPAEGQADVAARTASIQQAIDDASAYGTAAGGGSQGVVYVPKGEYYIGNLVLKSNVALYLQAGAALIGTGKTAHYEEHWFKDSMGRPATWWISTAFDSENIKIYGRGTIDGNGKLLHDDKSTNGRGMINNLVVPIATQRFEMDGVIVRESAGWAVMPVRSNDLAFTNLKMFNSLGMGENDGIDIVESQNAVVRRSIGIALDDPYSTKAWKEDTDIASGKVPWPGNPEPVRDVLVEDAIAWTLCYGFKVGQGVMQDQENITFRDGVVYRAAVGFAIHHKYGVGAVKNVTFEQMDVEDISGKNEDNSAWMTMFTVNASGNGVGPIDGVTVKNITVRDIGESIAKIKGAEGAEITNLTFENVYVPGKTTPATTLYEMNFLDRAFYRGVTILPVQQPEPRPRTNVALHRPAVSSSTDTGVETGPWAVDGNFGTRFGTKRGIDPGWLSVDLGSVRRIDEVHLYWEAAYAKSYQIQVSNDGTTWTPVFGTTAGKGGFERASFAPVDARYVRMYGTVRATQYGYSIWEFEVYGPESLPESISLDVSELTLRLGESAPLTATVLPEGTTHKAVRWSSSNPSVAAVDANGVVTALRAGAAVITAKTANGEWAATATVAALDLPEPILSFVSPSDANITYVGRWDRTDSAAYRSYWPGATVRVGFAGTNVRVRLGGAANVFAKIDDGPFVSYPNANGVVDLTRIPLTDGAHTLTLVAKDVKDSLEFEGLFVDEGASTLPSAAKERLIEFVGDSITVGYTTPQVSLQSYAWLTGEALGADHTQIAYTGICLVSGVSCYAPNALGMSDQYFKLKTGDDPASPDWNFASYAPSAIVLNLGTNDDKFQVSDADYLATYESFLARIRAAHPEAQLFVLRPFGGFKAGPTVDAVNARRAAGDALVHFVDTTGWIEPYPSAHFNDSLHPSVAGHAKIAERLAAELAPYLDPTLPMPARQPVVNPGFEMDAVGKQTPAGWQESGANPEASYTEADGGGYVARSGKFRLVHWKNADYEVETSQTIRELDDGYYTVRAYVRSSGGQQDVTLSAQPLGGAAASTPIAATSGSAYAPIELRDVRVAGGAMTIAFRSNAQAGAWLIVDDVELVRQLDAPTLLSAAPGDGRVDLQWSPVEGAVGYKIYVGQAPGAFGDAPATTAPADATSATIDGLTNGATYYFTVRATDGVRDGGPSGELAAVPYTVPAAPTNVAATAGDAQATIVFDAPTDDGGRPIARYEVLDAATGAVVAEGVGSPIVVGGLVNGVAYSFVVRAVNEAGAGLASLPTVPVTPHRAHPGQGQGNGYGYGHDKGNGNGHDNGNGLGHHKDG